MKNFGYLSALGILFILSGCATPLTQEQKTSIRRVAVVNEFPENPNFTHVGTTIFNNTYNEVIGTDAKETITVAVMEHLRSRGFLPEIMEGNSPPSGIDLVVKVIPRDIYGMAYTNGYGFYRRTFLAIEATEISYVALNLRPELNGKSRCSTCYGESQTKLAIDKMPLEWSQLTSDNQKRFSESLNSDIKKAVKIAFEKTQL